MICSDTGLIKNITTNRNKYYKMTKKML